jgi:hypothetical protein
MQGYRSQGSVQRFVASVLARRTRLFVRPQNGGHGLRSTAEHSINHPWFSPDVPHAPNDHYSPSISPEPPTSAGESFNLGRPSRIGSTVSA